MKFLGILAVVLAVQYFIVWGLFWEEDFKSKKKLLLYLIPFSWIFCAPYMNVFKSLWASSVQEIKRKYQKLN